jgi:integrase
MAKRKIRKQGIMPAGWKWRDGRPRWEPSPVLRKAGWKGQDLKDPMGRYLGRAASIDRAEKINNQVAAWRTGDRVVGVSDAQRTTRREVAPKTILSLVERYQKSEVFLDLRPNTQAEYKSKLRVLIDWAGDKMPETLLPAGPNDPDYGEDSLLQMAYRKWRETRGLATANGVIAVTGAMFTWAVKKNLIAVNPVNYVTRRKSAPRLRVASPAELQSWITTCDLANRHSLADAIVLATHTGLRQGDILNLTWRDIEKNRITIRTQKTDARVSIRLTRAARARLIEIKRRNRKAKRIAEYVILREGTWMPYQKYTFRHEVADHRMLAVKTIEQEAHARQLTKDETALIKGLRSLEFRDLRDTAITRLYEAGCTIPEIQSITLHSLRTINTVLEHYGMPTDRTADNAIAKYDAYLVNTKIEW